jgi:4-hydroxybenzoate decarboxylase
MWALATKFHPDHDLLVLPGMSIVSLDPGSLPPGITHKMVLDATTPMAPDVRGRYSQLLADPAGTSDWETRLRALLAEVQSGAAR